MTPRGLNKHLHKVMGAARNMAVQKALGRLAGQKGKMGQKDQIGHKNQKGQKDQEGQKGRKGQKLPGVVS